MDPSPTPAQYTIAIEVSMLQISKVLTGLILKFGLSEKHIKFEKIFLMVLTFTK